MRLSAAGPALWLLVLALAGGGRAAETRQRAAAEARDPWALADLRTANVKTRTLADYTGEAPTAESFTVIGLLGRGGYGIVEEVVLKNLEDQNPRRLAAKRVGNWSPGSLASVRSSPNGGDPVAMKKDILNADDLDAARKEVQILEALQGGPFIMKLWGIYVMPLPKDDPSWFIRDQKLLVMLLNKCQGGDFEKLAARDPNDDAAPSDAQITLLFAKFVIGLAYMHGKGYVHGDMLELPSGSLKPANVMICSDGNPRIIDFGETKPRTEVEQIVNAGGILGGTDGFIPRFLGTRAGKQERGANFRMLGFGSDVYALGVTLWQMYFVGHPKVQRPEGKFNILAPAQEHRTARQATANTPLPSTPFTAASEQGLRFELRFPELVQGNPQRHAAIFALANLLASQDQTLRPQNAKALLKTVFESEYMQGAGIPELDVQGTAAEQRALNMIARLNQDGIDAAAMDNVLLESDAYLGGLKVWDGQQEPRQDAQSAIGGYRCGGEVKIKVSMSSFMESQCERGKISDQNAWISFRLSPDAGRNNYFSKVKPVEVLKVPACNWLAEAQKANRGAQHISLRIPAGTKLAPGKYFFYGKVKRKRMKVTSDMGYTSQVKFEVASC
ncbi:kinase-like domain-containing protein [Hyaloraphidium curvatum]|nr:kinase-like domain-containing protein [Hyaloraphidium curvatum]